MMAQSRPEMEGGSREDQGTASALAVKKGNTNSFTRTLSPSTQPGRADSAAPSSCRTHWSALSRS